MVKFNKKRNNFTYSGDIVGANILHNADGKKYLQVHIDVNADTKEEKHTVADIENYINNDKSLRDEKFHRYYYLITYTRVINGKKETMELMEKRIS